MNELMQDFKRFEIAWLVNYLKSGRYNINCGICMHAKRVAFIDSASNVIKPFIIRDVYIGTDGICEDSRFCVNSKCEYNNNSPEDYFKAMGFDGKDANDQNWQKIQDNLELINQAIREEDFDLKSHSIICFDQPSLEWVKIK